MAGVVDMQSAAFLSIDASPKSFFRLISQKKKKRRKKEEGRNPLPSGQFELDFVRKVHIDFQTNQQEDPPLKPTFSRFFLVCCFSSGSSLVKRNEILAQ